MAAPVANSPVIPDISRRQEIEALSGQIISLCYQCEKCSCGCPLAASMDILPHRLIRLLNLGQIDKVLNSNTIWLCASCETCTTRCPNGIDIAGIMDTLRQLCRSKGIKVSEYSIPIFHTTFLSSIKRHGRVNETEMALTYSIKDAGWRGFIRLTGMGFAMFLRGKAKIRPSRVKARSQVRDFFVKREVKL